jgi:isopenicillin N synthase-like dioxygenase
MPDIQVVDYRSAHAPKNFARSLKETGFGVISNHPIKQDLIDWAYQEWGKFFKSTDKLNYPFDPKTHSGFISTELSETAKGFEKKDLKEFFHIYNETQCPPALCEKTIALKAQLTDLGSQLLSWVDEHTPSDLRKKLDTSLPEMIHGSELHLFRLIHYPPLMGNEPEGAMRAAAHGDINLLTMLPAATAEGLQAKMTTGQWVDVPINSNWIVVNAGDMLEECTGNYYPSTQHRVLNPIGEAAKHSRLSMPLFLHPRDDVRLSDKYTAHSYRMERYQELGLNNKETY